VGAVDADGDRRREAARLGKVDRTAARQVLLEISRVANDGRSLEELLAVPNAEAWSREGGTRTRGDVY